MTGHGLLTGKVVIVTGGGRGIGADISRVLASEGATVAVNYTNGQEPAQAVVDEILASGGKAQIFQADVSDAHQVNTMVESVAQAFGQVDGLVNNAIAGLQDGKFEQVMEADFRKAFDYGCIAPVNTTRACLPFFEKAGGGRIVNIVTELWNMAPEGWSVYLSGKGAMVGMSRSLAAELGPKNVTVNMVAPGWMVTEKVDPTSAGSIGFGNTLPLKRHGSAKEIGKACVFFLSDLGDYVTGAYLPVTGGRVSQMGS